MIDHERSGWRGLHAGGRQVCVQLAVGFINKRGQFVRQHGPLNGGDLLFWHVAGFYLEHGVSFRLKGIEQPLEVLNEALPFTQPFTHAHFDLLPVRADFRCGLRTVQVQHGSNPAQRHLELPQQGNQPGPPKLVCRVIPIPAVWVGVHRLEQPERVVQAQGFLCQPRACAELANQHQVCGAVLRGIR